MKKCWTINIAILALLWILVSGCQTEASATEDPGMLAETMLAETVAAYTDTPAPTETPTISPTPTETPTVTLTPTPTTTPSQTPTLTPTLVPPVYVTVIPDGLNFRGGPGTVYLVAGGAVKGDELLVTGQAYGCEWLQVEKADGKTGWVPADQVTFDSPCEWIAQLEIPPTPFIPTATPTNPGGTKFAIVNNTGQTLTVVFSGEYNYTFTIAPGRNQVNVIAGNYSIGWSCGGAYAYTYGFVSSAWLLQIDSCP